MSDDQVRAREGETATENKDLRQEAESPQHNASHIKKELTPNQNAFLAAFRLTGNVSRASKAAGVSRRRHYDWLDDEEYASEFSEATEEATDRLEMWARRRATRGLRKYRFDKNGEPINHPETGKPYYENVYSDILLMFLLKSLRPDKYRENLRIEQAGGDHTVRVEYDDNWYGNAEAYQAAEGKAAPVTNPA